MTRTKTGPLTLITLSQPLVEDRLDPVRKALEECLAAGETRLVLDLRGVSAIDSCGLEFFLDMRDALAGRGGSLRLVNPPPLIADVLAATRLRHEFEIVCEAEPPVKVPA